MFFGGVGDSKRRENREMPLRNLIRGKGLRGCCRREASESRSTRRLAELLSVFET